MSSTTGKTFTGVKRQTCDGVEGVNDMAAASTKDLRTTGRKVPSLNPTKRKHGAEAWVFVTATQGCQFDGCTTGMAHANTCDMCGMLICDSHTHAGQGGLNTYCPNDANSAPVNAWYAGEPHPHTIKCAVGNSPCEGCGHDRPVIDGHYCLKCKAFSCYTCVGKCPVCSRDENGSDAGGAGGGPVEAAATGGGAPRGSPGFGMASIGNPENAGCDICDNQAAIVVLSDNGTAHLCTKCEKEWVRQCAFCNDKVVMDAEDFQICRGCGVPLCVKHRSDTEGRFGFPLCNVERFGPDGKSACAGFVPCPWPGCGMPVMGTDDDDAGGGCPAEAFYACKRHSCDDIFCHRHQSGDTLDEKGDKRVTAVPCPRPGCKK